MKSPTGLVLVLLLTLTACNNQAEFSATQSTDNRGTSQAQKGNELQGFVGDSTTNSAQPAAPETQKVSLTEADTAASAAEAADRKIIRNANLTMEVNSTTETQQRITSIAEGNGGFVVTSESKQREAADPAHRTLDIKLVLRVPAARFGAVLDQVRGLANNLREENVAGQDVTEEFIDLEARIKSQRALEGQFLEIMKQARTVSDAMEVQRQLSDVRTDIEKLEGRKRFLENRASMSTITINLETPGHIAVSTTGFGRHLRDAVSESVELGSGLLLLIVRFLIIMVPVTIFILLPLGLVFRYFVRRAKRIQLAQTLSSPAGD
ncbi:MAG TPA: DUF4349 domain-containing protein [Pyrinomonadaceae bacterium]|nr:DUF4349 domain-containing protein [Pyrinomonadaceae bacterium]